MNLKLLVLITTILIFILNAFLLAQNLSLYGKVIDSYNGKPIKDVNIYLANTQIGTTTNKNGYFEFRKLPQGTFTVVLSHVAYNFIKREVKLLRKFNDLGVIRFSLKAYELETVLVTDDEDDIWLEQFEFFRENFIGKGENSDSTKILDPYKIDFWEEDNILFASSTDPIEITNKSLGYRLKYFLDYFEATDNYTKYSGNAVFLPLLSNSVSDSVRWEENRSETYKGSLRHFLGTLNRGYSMFMSNSVFNELSDDSLIDSISLKNNFPNSRHSSLEANYRYKIDSLNSKSDSFLNSVGFFIYYVENVPWEAARPFTEIPISAKNLLSDGNILTERHFNFSKFLRIYYFPDYDENSNLINYAVKYNKYAQGSYLELARDSVVIDIEGRYFDKFGIHTFGYFGQERISDMLPYEYDPKIE